MKKYLAVMIVVAVMMFSIPAFALEMPAVEGSFKYLPIAKALTLGASTMIADFSRDDSATPLSLSTLPKKILYSSSLKASVAWTIKGDSERNGLLPDYGGLEASVNLMTFLNNAGVINTNPNVALTFDTGMLIGLSKLLDNPSTLDLQPAVGASLRIGF